MFVNNQNKITNVVDNNIETFLTIVWLHNQQSKILSKEKNEISMKVKLINDFFVQTLSFGPHDVI